MPCPAIGDSKEVKMRAGVRVSGKAKANAASEKYEEAGAPRDYDGAPVDDKPRSVYELVTRQMLEQVKDDVNEVKGRVNTLLWLVTGAMLIELLMRVVK